MIKQQLILISAETTQAYCHFSGIFNSVQSGLPGNLTWDLQANALVTWLHTLKYTHTHTHTTHYMHTHTTHIHTHYTHKLHTLPS